MKNLLLILVILINISIRGQNTTPLLSNFRIENSATDRIYFDSSEEITATTSTGFIVPGRTIIGVKINTGNKTGHYFLVSKYFTFWDNTTIRYEGGSDLQNLRGKELIDFTLIYIENNINEPLSVIERYVTILGAGSHNGTTEDNAWSFDEMKTNTIAGMTIWIKAGDYGNKSLTGFSNEGTLLSPIKFIGYKSTPGDIISNYYNYVLNGTLNTLNNKEMPLFDGGGNGTFFNPRGQDYIIIRNFQGRNYTSYISTTASHIGIIIDNIIVKDMGDVKANIGRGIYFGGGAIGSHENRILNSVVINATATGIRVKGHHSLVKNTSVYCNVASSKNDLAGTTDYYIELNGNNNIVLNSLTYKDTPNGWGHLGHGFVIKAYDKSEYNLIDKCKSIGLYEGFSARRTLCKYNVFKNSEAHADIPNTAPNTDTKSTGGIDLFSGPSFNIFENMYVHHTNFGINAQHNAENNGTLLASNNIIRNCIFSNVSKMIRISNSLVNKDLFTDNKFFNNTFYNGDYLIYIYDWKGLTSMKGNEFKNNIFSNIDKKMYTYKKGNDYSGWDYDYNNIHNSWATIIGSNSLNLNPMFEDISNNNFRLKSKSLLIDAGKFLKNVKRDFEGSSRPQGNGMDMGAYEYHDSSISAIKADAGEDQEICQGESVTITASGGSGYSWNTGATTASITVNPNTTTTYTVTVSEGSASDTDSVTVAVNSITANAGSDQTIESGQSATFTASGGGTYNWSTGAITASITVNPSSTTSYTVTVSNANGCEDTDSVNITVNAAGTLTANAGNDVEICKGESTTLTASGGLTYSWNTGASTASITVDPNTTTTYTVTVTEGSASNTDTVTVAVSSVTANAGVDQTIESGQSVTLTATGGENYKWSTGDTTKSITVSPQKNITYSVTVSNTNGCEDTDDVQVSVSQNIVTNPPPANAYAGEDTSICSGESVTLTASGGSTYLWSTGDTRQSIDVNPIRTTTYTLSATRGGITNSDQIIITVDNCNAFVEDEIIENKLMVYPNPTKGKLNVKLGNTQESIQLDVLNINGSIIQSESVDPINDRIKTQMDLSGLSKGIYFVRLNNSIYNETKKILVY